MSLQRLGLAAASAIVCLLAIHVLIVARPYPVARLDPAAGGPLILEDRHGRPLRSIPARDGRPGRTAWVELEDISTHAVSTLLASEDQRFFEHAGVDPVGVARAVWLNLRAGGVEYGASTLTMQLMRMVHSPGEPRSFANKIAESYLALRVERSLSKREILEQYLNRAYYGHGAYGIEAAAQRYFGKPAAALSAGEATLLCVLPRNPSLYDPLRHRERVLSRRIHLLALLIAQGRMTESEAERVVREPLRIALHAPPFAAPHFVEHVLAGLPAAERARGGVVRTTLDARLQALLERRTAEHVAEFAARGVQQAGVVVLDTRGGEVLAMVGSGGFAGRDGELNITTWRRHPGSALKPFVYATAIEQGESPASVAFDVRGLHGEQRADAHSGREHGPVGYREALAGSYNYAAVDVLSRVGVPRVMDKLARAGVGALPGAPADYGLRLSLGSTKVRLIDLAAAYRVFANRGLATPARAVAELVRHDGSRYRPEVPAPRRVFSPEVAWLTLDMLADPAARRPAFGQELPADLPYRVAVKTGTARGFADTVAVFVTRELTVAAWSGRFDGGATHGVLGMEGAGPLARAALLLASGGRELDLPPRPEGIETLEVCALSGKRVGPACPHRKHEHFIAGTAPAATCAWHALRDGRVAVRYPPELRSWARRHGAAP